MPKKTHGLGRGLDSLFAGAEDWGTSIQEIPVGELDPNPDQPRRTFSPESISQLADSIREQGVLQPLLVAPASGGRYMIIAGERRYRAGRRACKRRPVYDQCRRAALPCRPGSRPGHAALHREGY